MLALGKFYIGYTEAVGPLKLYGDQIPRRYQVVDPRSGEFLDEGTRHPNG